MLYEDTGGGEHRLRDAVWPEDGTLFGESGLIRAYYRTRPIAWRGNDAYLVPKSCFS
jgi:hypothetical protein